MQGSRPLQVCKKLNTVISATPTLLYQMELDVEGYNDGPPGELCISDRLRLLRERRLRWLKLDWQHVSFLDSRYVIPITPLPYEMQGGTFFNVTDNGKICINETRLPSSTHPEPEYRSWVQAHPLVDITTDPSQDLLICLDLHGV